jgi:HTH-type transcriptional regulator, competence development regulator
VPTTPFGKQVRKHRIDANTLLSHMAAVLKVSPAYLSAVEMGRKPAHDELVRKAVAYFRSLKIDASDLFALADRTRKEIDVARLKEDERVEFAAFARRLTSMPPPKRQEAIKKLTKIEE